MNKFCIALTSLPPDGRDFVLDEAEIWDEPLAEFGMECRISKPLSVRLNVLPTAEGCVIRGQISGEVTMPCSRCLEDTVIPVSAKFEDFEEFPDSPADEDGNGDEGADQQYSSLADHIVYDREVPFLNLAAIAWEEFLLALPDTPLCQDSCKGLCHRCGANLNREGCNCTKDTADPRLAVFRNMTIRKP